MLRLKTTFCSCFSSREDTVGWGCGGGMIRLDAPQCLAISMISDFLLSRAFFYGA